MIKVEKMDNEIKVVIPVSEDPDDFDKVSRCQALVVEELAYLYKAIEDHYDRDTLFFMLKLAATTLEVKGKDMELNDLGKVIKRNDKSNDKRQ